MQIPIIIFMGMVIYAIIITGLFLAVFAGASKDMEDMRKDNATIREALYEQAKDSVNHRHEMAEAQEQKLELLKKYLKLQNEYAWYRRLMREINPEVGSAVDRKMREGKHEKVG